MRAPNAEITTLPESRIDNLGLRDDYENTVKPVLDIDGITLTGYLDLPYVVAVALDPDSKSQALAELQQLLFNGALSGTGVTVIGTDDETPVDTHAVFENIAFVLKVEDWRLDCVPDYVEDKEKYVEKRENSMQNTLLEGLSDPVIMVNRHVEPGPGEHCVYGQYQFFAHQLTA